MYWFLFLASTELFGYVLVTWYWCIYWAVWIIYAVSLCFSPLEVRTRTRRPPQTPRTRTRCRITTRLRRNSYKVPWAALFILQQIIIILFIEFVYGTNNVLFGLKLYTCNYLNQIKYLNYIKENDIGFVYETNDVIIWFKVIYMQLFKSFWILHHYISLYILKWLKWSRSRSRSSVYTRQNFSIYITIKVTIKVTIQIILLYADGV